MSYIGVPPVTGDFVILDTISTSATASYTLQRNSSNFSPESANHMLVSLNGSIQKPNSSFTVSGSTITFSSALTSSDVIDFILVLGNVNAVGVATTVSDNAITNAKTNFVSTSSAAGLQIKGDGTTDGTLQLNCSQNSHGIKLKSPAHSSAQSYTLTFPTTSPSAGKVLQTDGSGNLSFGGNTPSFHVYRTANQTFSSNTWTKVQVNVELFDTDNAFDNSSNYRFTPQEAGKYFIYGSTNNNDGITAHYTAIYKNGSVIATAQGRANYGSVVNCSSIIDFNGSSDYVELYAYYQGGTPSVHSQSRTYLGGYRLIGV